MKQAVKVLQKRADKINAEIEKLQKVIDEPEMLSDLEFARNDIANFELELIEIGKATELLNAQIQ